MKAKMKDGKKLLGLGAVGVGGFLLYQLWKKKEEPLPPEGEEEPRIELVGVEWESNPFEPRSSHTARVRFSNPTTKSWTYSAVLSLDNAVSVTNTITIPTGGQVDVTFPVVMPPTDGIYNVFLDVSVAGTVIARFQAAPIEVVTLPAIQFIEIIWES